MLKRLWSINEKDIEKQSVFWNIMSSSINSIVSMFLLLVVTRVCGIVEAGIFSLGFSTSQMMLTIGNYGMRNYQATDLNNKYSMPVYLSSRVVTNIAMMIIVVVFVLIEGYSWEKALVTILLCLLKVTDAVDDVFGGYYQKNGRLDVSGKLMTFRIMSYVIVFCIVLVILKNLEIACVFAVCASSIALGLLVFSTNDLFQLERPCRINQDVICLLKECLPLCTGAFLQIYMANIPKYAIDNYLSESHQACYNYLFMPCFVINLFVGFALQPLLVKMSSAWLHKEHKKFLKLCIYIYIGAVTLAAIVVMAGRLLGCQILSVVFGIDLMQYKEVLTILLIGGAFFAFSVIEQVILTVMRRQIFLILGFGTASLLAFIVADSLVEEYKLMGAAWTYTISSAVLFGIQAILIIYFYNRERRRCCCNNK